MISASNFTVTQGLDKPKVWKCIQKMYPTIPIDLITVTHYLVTHGYNEQSDTKQVNLLAYELTQLTNSVASTANLQYHAMLILELDIWFKFLETMMSAKEMLENNVHDAAMQECIENMVIGEIDLFDGMHACQSYLDRIGIEPRAMGLINDFITNVNHKINVIKKQTQIDSIQHNMNRLLLETKDFNAHNAVSGLFEVLKNIWNNKKVTSYQLQQITALSRAI